jgi:uncharacterized protein YndB with AHSA1/START domain
MSAATVKLHFMEELPQIERSIDLPADPDRVWEKLVDGDLSEEWMGVRLQPRPGGEVNVAGKEVIGTVEAVSPGESITWSWREPDGDPSQVMIDLEPIDGGTRVTVVERLLEYRITGIPPVLSCAA